jgi:EmrB/QacA subfamily drug resistance transporter
MAAPEPGSAEIALRRDRDVPSDPMSDGGGKALDAPAHRFTEEPPTRIFGRVVAYKYVVAAVFVSALFLDLLDTTIVNVALRSMGEDFATESIDWVVLGYTLSLAVWIPASGWMGDRFGTKKVFLTALLLFVGGSMACGAAQTIGQLISFRVLQGVGGGMLTPIGIAMLFRAFPPIERARASTIVMIPTLVAPALGPVLGGLITDTIGWRWIFFVNVPFGAAALAFGLAYLREHTEPTAGRFDVAGFVLSGIGLASITYAINQGPFVGWTDPWVIALGIIGPLAFAALVYVETHQPHPMLALRLLKLRLFRATNVVMAFAMASFLGLTFVIPLFLQGLRGLSPLESGLTTFPQAIGILISSQVAGRLYPRIGPRRLMMSGLLGASVAMSFLLFVGLETDLWWVRVIMFLRGLAMGFCFVPSQAASYAEIAPADNGRASAIFSTQRQMSASIGIALMATVLASFTTLTETPSDPARALTGYHWTFALCVLLSVIGFVLASVMIKDEDARETMLARRPSTRATPVMAD